MLFTASWFNQQNDAQLVIRTSSGVKLVYKNGCLNKTGDNTYNLVLSSSTGLLPGETVTVTPVEVKKTSESNYFDCYLRYKLNYYYQNDGDATYTQTTLSDPNLHLSISSFESGTNFLNSQYGEYTYLTTSS